jgi:FixJ family two-component response regulator
MRNAGFSVPVIMLTGQDDPGVAVELMLAGAADYIPKESLSPERLARSFRTALHPAAG